MIFRNLPAVTLLRDTGTDFFKHTTGRQPRVANFANKVLGIQSVFTLAIQRDRTFTEWRKGVASLRWRFAIQVASCANPNSFAFAFIDLA